MSVVAYTGLNGTGKSYGVVESVILPSLAKGRTVVTNVALKLGRLSDDYPDGRVITFPSDVGVDYFSANTIVPGAVYVIDEAWRWFPSGVRNNQVPADQKQFFTEHRHFVGEDGYSCEIVLVTQNLNQVASYVKTLVEETYISVKLNQLGQSKRFRIDVYSGVAEGVKPRGEVVRKLFGKYSPDIYQYYSSHTQNKTEYTAGTEQKVTDRTNIFKTKKFLSIVVFAPLLLGFGFYQVYQQFFTSDVSPALSVVPSVESSDDVSKPASESASQGVSWSNPLVTAAFDDVGLQPHPTARVAAVYESARGAVIQIDDSATSWPRMVPEHVCDFNILTDSPVCIVGDYVISQFTGNKSIDPPSSDDSAGSLFSAG